MFSFRFPAPGVAVTGLAPALALSLVALSACGGDSSSSHTSTSTTVSAALATATVNSVSPFDALRGDVARSNAENLTLSRQYQNAIAECMGERGWSYTPEDPYDPTADHGEEFGTSAYGAVHGYGVVQEYEISDAGGAATPPNPNADIVAALDDDESSRYNADLYGTYGPDGVRTGTPGCSQVASDQVWGADPIETVDGLRDRYDAAVAAAQLDPGLVAARREWYSCVSAAEGPIEIGGRAITAPEDMDDYVSSLLRLAGGGEVQSFADGGTAGNDIEGETLTDGSFWGVRGGDTPSDDELVDLAEREVQLWSADQQCRTTSGVDAALVAAESAQVQQLVAEFPELSSTAAGVES